MTAPLRLAAAVVEHALHVDLADPRRTLGVLRWLTDVLPDEGPLSKRMILPKAIATVERILQGEMSPNAKRNGRKLKPEHRPILARLVREHRTLLPVASLPVAAAPVKREPAPLVWKTRHRTWSPGPVPLDDHA